VRIGTVLRKWRSASERPLREVAQEMGIHYSTLARIEKGAAPPSDSLIKIALWLMKSEEASNGIDPSGREQTTSGIAAALSIDSLEGSDREGE